MTDKKQIIIDGVDVSECNFLGEEGICNSDSYFCEGHTYCYFKQLQKEKFENLNNRQMVESAENLIYENSELYKNLKEKEQECEKYKKLAADFKDVNKQLGYKYLTIKDECEELKEYLQANQSTGICETCAAKAILQNDKYHKALKEIDKVINNIFDRCLGHKTDGCTPVHNVCEELIKILDIINKAKGEK